MFGARRRPWGNSTWQAWGHPRGVPRPWRQRRVGSAPDPPRSLPRRWRTGGAGSRGDGACGARGQDFDFHLHRRVLGTDDGVPALRGYRCVRPEAAAAGAVADRGEAGTPEGNAEVEAAVLAAAVAAKRAGDAARRAGDGPGAAQAPPAAGTHSRTGDLRAETAWLLPVTRAHLRRRPRDTAAAEPSATAAGSGS
ncbi:DUF6545 domain-containing protein [Streptomyces sp. NPDC002044]|uniref:DUF6545 domain-containing protein n=1 Tax=Streptomyces sp. NPDC002044 TaxID=3154662 RepID=UPI003334351E